MKNGLKGPVEEMYHGLTWGIARLFGYANVIKTTHIENHMKWERCLTPVLY
jgi:hypothetical protein